MVRIRQEEEKELGMMTGDGEFVFDKLLRLLDKRARGEWLVESLEGEE